MWSLLLLLLLAAPAGAACVGDCAADDRVAINELVAGVSIALGAGELGSCPSFDADGDGVVGIAELIAGVNNALSGCGAASTPTAPPPSATPTVTPTVTATPASGPRILFFGITASDDSLQKPTGTTPEGVPIYERPFGFSFSLVVEAAHGPGNAPVGSDSFRDGAPLSSFISSMDSARWRLRRRNWSRHKLITIRVIQVGKLESP